MSEPIYVDGGFPLSEGWFWHRMWSEYLAENGEPHLAQWVIDNMEWDQKGKWKPCNSARWINQSLKSLIKGDRPSHIHSPFDRLYQALLSDGVRIPRTVSQG